MYGSPSSGLERTRWAILVKRPQKRPSWRVGTPIMGVMNVFWKVVYCFKICLICIHFLTVIISLFSARRTCVRTLKKKKIEDRRIARLTGHQNLKSLDDYDEEDMEEQEELSHIMTEATTPGEIINLCLQHLYVSIKIWNKSVKYYIYFCIGAPHTDTGRSASYSSSVTSATHTTVTAEISACEMEQFLHEKNEPSK